MLGLVVRFDIENEDAAALFDELTAEVVAHITASEPGTLVYATHVVRDKPLARVFFEVYADEEAFQVHEEAEHVISFHSRKAPLLAREPRVELLQPGPVKAGWLP